MSATEIIENFDLLTIEDKEYTAELIYKNLKEARQQELIDRVKEAEANYHAGNYKIGTVEDLFKDLEDE